MLYESGSATGCAAGIASDGDLWDLAERVCEPHRCPLTDPEIRAVFAKTPPVVGGDKAANLQTLKDAIYRASERAWDEGRE